jgi:uncharacterized membrane protein YdcZ (DUF606 family)
MTFAKIILAVLASLAGIYALLSIVCYISEHDGLIMLHMYSTPIILSGALGAILILTRSRTADPKRPGAGNP